jgi:hypothetical protein
MAMSRSRTAGARRGWRRNGQAEHWQFPVPTQTERVLAGTRHASRGGIARSWAHARDSRRDPAAMECRVHVEHGEGVSEHEKED